MGLMDSIKKATGLGLTPEQHYDRAYEKGVLLGPDKYGEAAALFQAAAAKASEVGNNSLQARALANAFLYEYIATGNAAKLELLREQLTQLQDIERIGTRSETMPAAVLAAEIEGRLIESQLFAAGPGSAGRPLLHQRASEAFKKIFSESLCTYRFHARDQHAQTAQSRFFLNQGLMSWHEAILSVDQDPEAAAEHAGRALNAFRQCQDEGWSKQAETWLNRCRTKRTCWMCHREFQGLDVHVRNYPAKIAPYAVSVVTKLGEDATSLDRERGNLSLCTPCGTAVEKQAERYVDALRKEIAEEMKGMQATIATLLNAVKELQRHSHHH